MTPLAITLTQARNPSGALNLKFLLRGSLEKSGVDALSRRLDAGLEEQAESILIDISGVTVIDAEGLHRLSEVMRAAEARGATLSLVNGGPQPIDATLKTRELPGGVTLVELVGHLDQSGTSAVESPLLALCHRDKPLLILDLSCVDLIVSIGIRLILRVIKDSAAYGGRVLFLEPTPAVSTALDFSALTKFVARGKAEDVAAMLTRSAR